MNPLRSIKVEAHQFASKDFIGGIAALDFINTVTGRDKDPRDWIDSYRRLLEWAALTQLLPRKQLRALEKAATEDAEAAANALVRAKQLREACFEIISGIADRKEPSASSLALLRERWIAGVTALQFRFDSGRIRTEAISSITNLDLISSVLAYRIVEEVLPLPIERIRLCDGENCSWVFFDNSKAGRRRWCDMAVCGNTAKTHRFRANRSGLRR
jgi:predicted RNA-binding Zn ribbon-like protein